MTSNVARHNNAQNTSLCITTLGAMTLSNTTFRIMSLGIIRLSMTTSITTLSKMTQKNVAQHNDFQYYNIQQNVAHS